DGGTGADTLIFNGSVGAEIFAAQGNLAGDLIFTRDVGNVVMDLVHVETIMLNVPGGADTVTIRDTTGTDLTAVNINLGVNGAGDTAVDSVIINGTGGADVFQAVGLNGNVMVT